MICRFGWSEDGSHNGKHLCIFGLRVTGHATCDCEIVHVAVRLYVYRYIYIRGCRNRIKAGSGACR